MRRITLLLTALFFALTSFSQATNWPNWRGPALNGVASTGNSPTEWSETKNVKWKVKLPGKGHSTPIIWGDIVYVTSAVATTSGGPQKFVVTAYNKNNGSVAWEKTLAEEVPAEGTHVDGSWASNSPITDGKNIFVFFGSRGLFCLDLQGNIKWSRDFGNMQIKMSFGEGSSPALYKDKVVILWDDEVDSKIIVVDAATGKDVWLKKRDEKTTWTTPLIVEFNGKVQIIAGGTNKIRSYDMANGDIIWETPGLTENVIPQPIYDNGMLYIMSGYRGNSVMAIDLSKASGNIQNSDAIVWSLNKNAPYVPSPALYNGSLYYLWANNGKLSNVNAKTGTVIYEAMDLPGIGSAYPSPTVAAGNLYFFGSTGTGHVVKTGADFQIVATNKLNDKFHASPAFSGNAMYLRGFEYLYCISAE